MTDRCMLSLGGWSGHGRPRGIARPTCAVASTAAIASFAGFLPVIGIRISFWPLAALRGFFEGFDALASSAPATLRPALPSGDNLPPAMLLRPW